MKIKKLLVANRGEIAVRIIRAAKELDIPTVAIFSDADAGALHVRLADERVNLSGSRAADTYLHQEKIIAAALETGANAIHPGYGFFSERASFAEAVRKEKIIFVGPSTKIISLMGDKDEARRTALKAKVPVVPGTTPGEKEETFKKTAKKIGYPVIVKAVAGGSGRGMRVVNSEVELVEKISEAKREAKAAFGKEEVILEKFLKTPRHIEVQIFGDGKKVIHLFERECSVQRRHQKLIEEAPATNLHQGLRKKILDAAVKLAAFVKYESAGTLEFLVDGGTKASDKFYFLEMNTRIQVEHPVTELITGVDLVKWQLLLAGGIKPKLSQKEIKPAGHAIEFRINAEDAGKDFKPAMGEVLYVSELGGPGVRIDSWIENGSVVSPHYDSLLSKIIVHGTDRHEALIRAKRILGELIIEGLPTTADFHRWLISQPDFIKAKIHVYWIKENYKGETTPSSSIGPLIIKNLKQ